MKINVQERNLNLFLSSTRFNDDVTNTPEFCSKKSKGCIIPIMFANSNVFDAQKQITGSCLQKPSVVFVFV